MNHGAWGAAPATAESLDAMPTYEFEDQMSWRWVIPILVLAGVLVGLFYIGPSGWTLKGLVAPAAAGVIFVGVLFIGLKLISKDRVGIDRRLGWFARMGLGFVSGGAAGLVWSIVEDGGQSILPSGLIGGGLGALMGLFEA